MITTLNKMKLKIEIYLYCKFEIFKVLNEIVLRMNSWNKIYCKFEIIISIKMKLKCEITYTGYLKYFKCYKWNAL